MTTRSQKRKAVAELVPGDFETSIAENIPSENLAAGHYCAQASYFAAFRGIRDTKIEKSRGIQDKISL